jgi:uncharacterized protein (TIGR02246 family)
MFWARKGTSVVLLLSFLGVVACSGPPPADTSEADIQAIRAIVDDFDIAVIAGDYEAVAELYDENAIRMPAEAPPQIGKAAIREWFRLEAEQYVIEIDNVVRDAQVFGDWGYMWGDATGLLTPRDGSEPITVDSKWMAVNRRQADGSWKTYRDIYNANNPPPPPPGGQS